MEGVRVPVVSVVWNTISVHEVGGADGSLAPEFHRWFFAKAICAATAVSPEKGRVQQQTAYFGFWPSLMPRT